MTKLARMRELVAKHHTLSASGGSVWLTRAEISAAIVDEYGPHTQRQLSALWSKAQRPAKAVGRPRRARCAHCHGTGLATE